jgi:hypothetical protein
MRGEDFRALARQSDYQPLLGVLHERFAKSRLVVIDEDWASARVLLTAGRVAVGFPKALHDCVHETDRPWGCCAGDCGKECCEKGLGSPTVTVTWTDGDETITYHYSHTIGVSRLERRSGDRRTRYACLTDQRGTLRASGDLP